MGHFEIAIEIVGDDLSQLNKEAGGHRIQRIPPTEKRGRVHTSTITVAIIDPDVKTSDSFSKREESDFRVEWFNGTGKGGQNRNKVACSCRLIHIPTGIMETRQSRERIANLRDAKAAIFSTLDAAQNKEKGLISAKDRKDQVGSGMRGDKTVTIRFQDDMVNHHETDKSMSAKQYMKGFMDQVW